MLDATATTKGRHTSVDVLVKMKSLLGLGNASAGVHEDGIEEIRVTVVELAADPRERASGEGSERLLLAGCDVSKDSDICEE